MVLILNRDKWYLLIDCNIEDGLMVVYIGDKGHPYIVRLLQDTSSLASQLPTTSFRV